MRETDVAEKFGLFKGSVEALNAENRRAERAEFGLYKSQIEGDFGLYKAGRRAREKEKGRCRNKDCRFGSYGSLQGEDYHASHRDDG